MEKTEKGRGDYADDVHPERSVDLGQLNHPYSYQNLHISKDLNKQSYYQPSLQQISMQPLAQVEVSSCTTLNPDGIAGQLSHRDNIGNEFQADIYFQLQQSIVNSQHQKHHQLHQNPAQHYSLQENHHHHNNHHHIQRQQQQQQQLSSSQNPNNTMIAMNSLNNQQPASQSQLTSLQIPSSERDIIQAKYNNLQNNIDINEASSMFPLVAGSVVAEVAAAVVAAAAAAPYEESILNASIADERKNQYSGFSLQLNQQEHQLLLQSQKKQQEEQEQQRQKLFNEPPPLPKGGSQNNLNSSVGFRLEAKAQKHIHSMTEKKLYQEKEKRRLVYMDQDALEQMDADCMSECQPQLIPKFTYCVNMPQNLPKEQSYEALRAVNRRKYQRLSESIAQLDSSPVVVNYMKFLQESYKLAQERPEECAHLLITLETQFDLILHVTQPPRLAAEASLLSNQNQQQDKQQQPHQLLQQQKQHQSSQFQDDNDDDDEYDYEYDDDDINEGGYLNVN